MRIPAIRNVLPHCHPEQAAFAQRGIWVSRALCRVLCDTIIARLARNRSNNRVPHPFAFFAKGWERLVGCSYGRISNTTP
jgi:hypothetical protein